MQQPRLAALRWQLTCPNHATMAASCPDWHIEKGVRYYGRLIREALAEMTLGTDSLGGHKAIFNQHFVPVFGECCLALYTLGASTAISEALTWLHVKGGSRHGWWPPCRFSGPSAHLADLPRCFHLLCPLSPSPLCCCSLHSPADTRIPAVVQCVTREINGDVLSDHTPDNRISGATGDGCSDPDSDMHSDANCQGRRRGQHRSQARRIRGVPRFRPPQQVCSSGQGGERKQGAA